LADGFAHPSHPDPSDQSPKMLILSIGDRYPPFHGRTISAAEFHEIGTGNLVAWIVGCIKYFDGVYLQQPIGRHCRSCCHLDPSRLLRGSCGRPSASFDQVQPYTGYPGIGRAAQTWPPHWRPRQFAATNHKLGRRLVQIDLQFHRFIISVIDLRDVHRERAKPPHALRARPVSRRWNLLEQCDQQRIKSEAA
jgi:hypothetical protein